MEDKSVNNGATGNGPGDKTWPAQIDWLAGINDNRLLFHWGVMP